MKDPLFLEKRAKGIKDILIAASDEKEAAKEILTLFYGGLNMERKYYAILNEAAKNLGVEKATLNAFFKNLFLSESLIFNKKKFRHIKSFSELNKKEMQGFLNDVLEFLNKEFNLNFE